MACGVTGAHGEDHHVRTDHYVFTGSAVCSAAARLGDARCGVKERTAAGAALEPEPPAVHRVGWGFISLYTLAYMGTSLLFLAPLLVTLALKVDSLVGLGRAPGSLAVVAGTGALLAMVANPFFGRMSDRTTSRLGMRRPWMVTGLVGGSVGIVMVALAPSIPVVLAGWCIAQVFFNALLAAMVAVMPDQVPPGQRGLVSGVLGVCTPVGSVCGTFVVKLFTGNTLAMFLGPCAAGGFFILVVCGRPERPPAGQGRQAGLVAAGIRRHVLRQPAEEPGLRLGFRQPFHVRPGLCVPGYLPGLLPAGQDRHRQGRRAAADISRHARPVRRRRRRLPASAGRLSDRIGRRKIFVLPASVVYGLALFTIAVATSFNGFLVGMAISGLGFGVYLAVDLALVVDVLPDKRNAAKDLGVFNIAGALPFSIAPAIAPAILAIGGGSYGVLYTVAGLCAIISAVAILPVRRVR